MTKVDPPIPMKNLRTVNPEAVFTSPVNPVGIALINRMIDIGIRGPYLSQNGPKRKRMMIVPETAEIDDVHICSLVRSRED
jgi:hypothetical protein